MCDGPGFMIHKSDMYLRKLVCIGHSVQAMSGRTILGLLVFYRLINL